MRVPIILMLLVVLLLPADVRSFAGDVAAQVKTASVAIVNFLDRNSNDEDAATARPTKVAALR